MPSLSLTYPSILPQRLLKTGWIVCGIDHNIYVHTHTYILLISMNEQVFRG